MEWFRKALYVLFGSPPRFDGIAETYSSYYMTEDEIVDHFIGRLSDEALKSWIAVAKDDLIGGHHGTGRNIRNYYALWHEENPYTDSSDPMGDLHPDNMSGRIIERIWERARQLAESRGIPVPPLDPGADERIAKRRAAIRKLMESCTDAPGSGTTLG